MTRERSELLQSDLLDALVGVIDLKHGLAVHAVAGQRDKYAPIERLPSAGDAVALAQRYRRLGLKRIYLADLDALDSRGHQLDAIESILRGNDPFDEVHVDIGWTGHEHDEIRALISRLLVQFPATRMVAATESATTVDSLWALAHLVSADRVTLGLDYRGGQLLGAEADEAPWLAAARELNLSHVIALDLHAVGTGQGVVTQCICRRVKRALPDVKLLSGGGVRSAEDVHALLNSGCSACLVATALM